MSLASSLAALGSLAQSVESRPEESRFLDTGEFAAAHGKVMARLEADLKTVRDIYRPLFHTDQTAASQTRLCSAILREWALMNDAPSLAAICMAALETLGVKDEEYGRLVMLAAVLGEIENPLPYHSNMHYRKVTLQLIRLIAHHNEIYAGTAKLFSDRNICLLLAAACVHDLAHDGRGNTVQGVHERARLENLAFHIICHWMEPLGFTGKDVKEAIRTMLVSTDVSPVGDPRAPVAQMKAAYRHHFFRQEGWAEPLNLSADLKPLENNPELTMMALILQEADIATSAGIEYAVTKFETALVCEEYKMPEALPQHIINFMRDVCGRQFISDAGQRLYAANMARIFALAQKDVDDGNLPLPDSHHADLVLGAGFGALLPSDAIH